MRMWRVTGVLAAGFFLGSARTAGARKGQSILDLKGVTRVGHVVTSVSKVLAVVFVACLAPCAKSALGAIDTGAAASGNWNDPTIWTTGTVPNSSNNVYIGSTFPAGAASTATVTLTAPESANNVYLGAMGSGVSGSLDLAGYSLTVNDNVVFGQPSGSFSWSVSGLNGLTTPNLYMYFASSYGFGANDAVSNLYLINSANVSTAATGNVTGSVNMMGSDLTLGANTTLSGSIDLSSGSLLTVDQVGGMGLTLNGTSLSDLTIDPSSMDLIFSINATPTWDFRWQDPVGGGNWVSTLEAMIASGQITSNVPTSELMVFDSGGYTYIGAPAATPEPSSILLLGMGITGLGVARWRKRKQAA